MSLARIINKIQSKNNKKIFRPFAPMLAKALKSTKAKKEKADG